MTEYSLRVDDARADDVEFALDGLLPADAGALPVPLPAPTGVADGDRVVLVDSEAVPFAAVDPVQKPEGGPRLPDRSYVCGRAASASSGRCGWRPVPGWSPLRPAARCTGTTWPPSGRRSATARSCSSR